MTNWLNCLVECSSKICDSTSVFCYNFLQNNKKLILASTIVSTAIYLHFSIKKKNLRIEWNSAGENVVVLHCTGRATTCPNLSPFVLKLETYLRMANIKYVIDTTSIWGSKGKTPWITFNGKDYADSQLIIEFLGQKFKQDFSSHLSQEERAISRAFLIMTDEHLLWGLAWWRLNDPDKRILHMVKDIPVVFKLMYPMFQRKIRHMLWCQGLGRHSDKDIIDITRKDLQALSDYLGKKKFLLGNEPCETDCAVFAHLVQFAYAAPGSPFATMMQEDYRNLLHYIFRMKERFWSDWKLE